MNFLNANESQYGPSPQVLAALNGEENAVFAYPEITNIPIRAKIAQKYGVGTENIAAANGSSTILDCICRAFLRNGGETIFCDPTFFIYGMFTAMNGGKPIALPLTRDMRFDLEGIEKAVTDNTDIVFICNPNNPTGTYLSAGELWSFIQRVPSHVMVVVDEAYMDFADAPDCTTMIPRIDAGNLIVVRTFSKLYGIAGARLGYAVSAPGVIERLLKTIPPYNINRFAPAAAMAALDCAEYYGDVRRRSIAGRRYLAEGLEKLGLRPVPSQGSFILFHLPASADPEKIDAALTERGYKINFALKQAPRVSIGTEEQNEGFISALTEILERGENA